ncbi:MAG: hypothetical protein ACFFD1_09990 [Candidatus Thorarchaeota archaeon]
MPQINNYSYLNIYLAPTLRFLVELTTWSWFLLAALMKDTVYILFFFLSVFLLAVFNFPGDKMKDGPINVQGWVRISIEAFSALLGVFGAWVLFGDIGLLLQLTLTIFVFIVDFERLRWMLGLRKNPPIWVKNLGR